LCVPSRVWLDDQIAGGCAVTKDVLKSRHRSCGPPSQAARAVRLESV
jgi:hypothetical protein